GSVLAAGSHIRRHDASDDHFDRTDQRDVGSLGQEGTTMKMTNGYTRAVVWTLVCGQLTLAMPAMPVAADASHVAQMERYKWRTFGAASAAVPTAFVPPPMQAPLSVLRPVVRPRRRITPNRTVPVVRPV